MRRMLRRVMALVVCMCMLASILSTGTILADDTKTITVGGITLSGSLSQPAYANTDSYGNVSNANSDTYSIMWDGETLTLKDATIRGAMISGARKNEVACIHMGNVYDENADGYNVKILGSNMLIGQDISNSYDAYSYGIYADKGNISIFGEGSLTFTGGNTTITKPSSLGAGFRGISAGIYANSGNVIIRGGTLNLTAGSATVVSGSYTGIYQPTAESYGIYANNSLTAEGGNITISGGSVTATSGAAENYARNEEGAEVSQGVFAAGNIVVSPQSRALIKVVAGEDSSAAAIKGSPFISENNIKTLVSSAKYFYSETISIADQPDSVSVTEGEAANFSITATGTNPTYQWYESTDDGKTWTKILDANARTYSITETTMDMNNRQYRCMVFFEDVKATLTSDAALLNVWPKTYTITVNSEGDGSASAIPTSAAAGETITLTATANSGYHFKGWQVESGNVTIGTDNTFVMPAENVTIKAIFEKDTPQPPTEYSITVETDGNGSAMASETSAAEGTSITLSATANSGYHFKGWQVESGNVTIGTDNTFVMPAENVTIKAIFEKDTPQPPTEYSITVETDGNGSAMASETSAAEGTSITLSATAKSGYHFERWEVVSDNVAIENNSFTMPAEDVTIKAVFARNNGGGGTVIPSRFTLTFDTNGGSAIDAMRVSAGTTVDLSDYQPTRAGYDFTGWYADEALTEHITNIRMTGNKTVYAGWTQQTPPVEDELPFIDVDEDDWFYDPVRWVFEQGLMTGTSATTFEPNISTTRGMIVSIFHRLEGSPMVSESLVYDDVADGDWYAEAVRWATTEDIVGGFGDGTFRPNEPITREQMASILYRYAEYKGYDISARADLSAYSDQPSAWAEDVMQWAVAEGLLNGVTDDQLQPQGNATRVQVAAIFQRFLSE